MASIKRNVIPVAAWLVVILAGLALLHGCAAKPYPARLTIHVTGNIRGHIKNCGCASGQYGGLLRMSRLAAQEVKNAAKPQGEDRGRPAVAMLIDMGDFIDPATKVSRLTSRGVVLGMSTMGYDVVGVGQYELSFTQEELWDMLKDSGLPLTAANLHFITTPNGEDYSAKLNALIKRYRVVEFADGFRVGVIHVIDDNVQQVLGELNGFELREAEAAAKDVLESHLDEADFWVLTISDTRAKGTGPQAIAALTDLDLVIGFKVNNPLEPEDSTEVLFPYFIAPPYLKAKDVMQVEVSFTPAEGAPKVNASRLAIPDTIKPDQQVQAVVDQIDERLEILENEEAAAWLDQETVHPVYTGHESCRKCHAGVVTQHLATHHTSALSSLVNAGQNNSAACLPCHVVGHHNLPGVTSSGGWNKIDDQLLMRGVQCESCHGPGEYHLAAMLAMTMGRSLPEDVADALAADGRNEYGLRDAGREMCLVCHDPENSPDFDYDSYWKKIAH